MNQSHAAKKTKDPFVVIDQVITALITRAVFHNGDLTRLKLGADHKQLQSFATDLDFTDAEAALTTLEAWQAQDDDISNCSALLHRALDQYRSSGNRIGQMEVLSLLSDLAGHSEDWESGVQLSRQLLALATAHGSQPAMLKSYANQAKFKLHLGNSDEAKDIVTKAMDSEYFRRQVLPVHADIYAIAFEIASEERDVESIRKYSQLLSDPITNRFSKTYEGFVKEVAKVKKSKAKMKQDHQQAALAIATRHNSEQRQSRSAIVYLKYISGVLVVFLLGAFGYISRVRLARAERQLKEQKQQGQIGEEIRKGLETRLQRMQRVESLGLMAGGIAHDFNNLLVGVLGNAGLARITYPEDQEELKSRIKQIMVSAAKAANLSK